jgi:hypothetical protein
MNKRSGATEKDIGTTPRDPGALSGLLAGGPIHGVGFGVLALAGLRTGELPRPVSILGLTSAASGLLSPLYFVKEAAGWFIPVGRFSGLLVSAIAGVRLARTGEPGTTTRGRKTWPTP